MFHKISLKKGYIISLFIIFGLVLNISCASAPTTKEASIMMEEEEETPALIESINVISDAYGQETTIEIINSEQVPYTAFKLVQPSRIVLDIKALPSSELNMPSDFNSSVIKEINLEEIEGKPLFTRFIAILNQDAEYNIQEQYNEIMLSLLPGEVKEESEKTVSFTQIEEEETINAEPRLFFSPGKSNLNEIIGVDFYMLPKDKSRVTVTTSRKAEYQLSRKDSLTLLLEVMDARIPAELTRYINSSQFKGVVSRITPVLKVAERKVDLEIELKEMVPYHVVQTDGEIRVDFNKTTVNPPEKKITQANLAKAPVKLEEVPSEVEQAGMMPTTVSNVTPAKGITRGYSGARMTLDFSNSDIRNILKLIGEVSKLNIVWGPEVKGTVSMRLKNVPWDQALDVVLDVNDLGMRREGNIIRIMTKQKIKALEKDEEEKRQAERDKVRELAEEKKAAKAEEPLITEYITVNYQDVEAIKSLIEENVRGPRGKLSVDKATKTIIMTDIASNIKEAQELKDRQDKPVKQVMIEARIVEASTGFERDIGVEWGLTYQDADNPWGGSGPDTVNYGFATNFTLPGATTAGISFANTAATKVLNAQIALAETEGKVKTLSAPKIITRDTKTAMIKQGTQISVPTGVKDGEQQYEQVDAALKLEVTPNITPNDMVIMNINVSDDYPDYANAVSGNVPIKTKNAETEMMVASGDTVIIGGIYKEEESTSREGVPWLSKIPILGWLFKREYKTKDTSELLIFLTPTVVYASSR